MKKRKEPAVPARIAKVRKRFEKWRKTRKAKEKIPKPLLEAAVKLTDHYSVHKVSRALRLNHTTLDKEVERARASNLSSESTQPTFLEVAMPAPMAGQPECIIELENSHGEKMRIIIRGQRDIDLGALGSSFWRTGS